MTKDTLAPFAGLFMIRSTRGTTLASGTVFPAAPPAGWNVVAVTALAGHPETDVVFEKGGVSQVMIWDFHGTQLIGTGMLSSTLSSGWNVVGPR